MHCIFWLCAITSNISNHSISSYFLDKKFFIKVLGLSSTSFVSKLAVAGIGFSSFSATDGSSLSKEAIYLSAIKLLMAFSFLASINSAISAFAISFSVKSPPLSKFFL